MKHLHTTPAAIAALLLVGLAMGCGGDAPDPGPDAGVRAVLDRYLAAIEARDTAALADLFVDDGRFAWIEDGAVRYRSADDVVAALNSFGPGTPIHTELTGLTVVPLGDDAAHAFARFTTTVGDGGGAFAYGGAMSILAERREGAWRVVGGHVSAPRPRRDGASADGGSG